MGKEQEKHGSKGRRPHHWTPRLTLLSVRLNQDTRALSLPPLPPPYQQVFGNYIDEMLLESCILSGEKILRKKALDNLSTPCNLRKFETCAKKIANLASLFSMLTQFSTLGAQHKDRHNIYNYKKAFISVCTVL